MKIALVDDEQKSLDEIKQLCSSFEENTGYPVKTFLFDSGEEFLAAFQAGCFDLVFMDIYMENMNGVSAALEMRRQDSGCLLVFLTSSMEFMPDAFSCHAFEYIVKPFSEERVAKVLEDAMSILLPYPKYMEINSNRRIIPVFYRDIISAVTDGHYLDISLTDESILRSRLTMSEFICKTHHDPRFILINKGILINADHVLDFENNCCLLENGKRLPIRVRGHVKIKQLVKNYRFFKNW